MKKATFKFELRRKILHSFFGLFLISILFCSGRKNLILFLSLLLLLGSIMVVWRIKGRRIPVADWFEETFEREHVRFPGYGAFWYVVGTLLAVLTLGNSNEVAAAILTLALGDSAATIVGVRACHSLPHNRCKTVEGSIAFFVFSLPVCLFVGWIGVALAALTAIVESLPSPIDDNLAVPVAAVLFFLMLGPFA
jgi:dolichol kinase